MAILGAHMSIAGGYHRAVERAAAAGCDCVQLFTRNNTQWQTAPITSQQVAAFSESLNSSGIKHSIAHASYLINLASPDEHLWLKSVQGLETELRRAEVLGLAWVVVHPGCYTTADEATGLRRVASAIDEVHARIEHTTVGCLLETTAGQGTSLGWRFEHLAEILALVRHPQRLGVCFDTSHVFAAGYPLRTAGQYEQTMTRFDRLIGLERIKAFHLNDSRSPRGSRIDRHEHIGHGRLGLSAFRNLLGDERFCHTPMYLETPKGVCDGADWDVINLDRLRQIALRVRPSPDIATGSEKSLGPQSDRR